MDLEEYEEALDKQEAQEEQQEEYDQQKEEQRRMGYGEGMAYPMPKESESLYNLFHKVLELSDSSKVANLDKTELGMLNLSARDCQRIALLANTLNHPKFAFYFMGIAEIILRTSASKKGWFTELFVSQKKFSAKSKEELDAAKKKKKKFGFGSSSNEGGQ